jgi:hypothetical protein
MNRFKDKYYHMSVKIISGLFKDAFSSTNCRGNKQIYPCNRPWRPIVL